MVIRRALFSFFFSAVNPALASRSLAFTTLKGLRGQDG